MFALPNLMSHVSSAAFAQARLRAGSGLLILFTRLLEIINFLTRSLEKTLLPLARDPKNLPC